MTTETNGDNARLARLTANIARMEELTRRLASALTSQKSDDLSLHAPSPDLYAKAAGAYVAEMMQNPAKLMEQQAAYWGKAVQHYQEAQQALASGSFKAPEDHSPTDRRFANPLWQTHPYFNFIKQQYLMNAQAVKEALGDLSTLPPEEARRVDYFAQQIIDMMSPTNFLATNPDALERALETDGESLVKGLENLIHDLEANNGELIVRLADEEAFKVGENLATTPGQVVFRNRMLELIQYAPTTKKVHATPLVIFPPWINKFYILDLKPVNSLVKWIVDQGYTLFVVSWVNPDASYKDVTLEDYIREGFLTAMDEVRAITGESQVNAVGYCIAGTTLSLTLAYLNAIGDDRVKSATFFTTLTDFSDPGEVGVFLNDDFVDGIERQCAADGVLSRHYMARTFSFLRANDLIWQPAIRSYMMGETPPAFDLLYWNGDGTNLPGPMAVRYLRGLCQANEFARDGFEIMGRKLHLSHVQVPLCAVACETDHIAPWASSFAGIRQMGSADKTFILAQSGHIAGIVSPPGKDKYGHYTSAAALTTPEDWKAGAQFTKGSWWPRWQEWLAERSGAMVPARAPGDSAHPPLAPAPGTYVTARPASVA